MAPFKMRGITPLKQTEPTGTTTTTKEPTELRYPDVRNLGDEEYRQTLLSLPGSVFDGGINTGDVMDINQNAYDEFSAGKPGM